MFQLIKQMFILLFFPFMISLDRCNENCNTLDLLEYVIQINRRYKFKFIQNDKKINEAKTLLIKHIPFDCKCKFDRRKCKVSM